MEKEEKLAVFVKIDSKIKFLGFTKNFEEDYSVVDDRIKNNLYYKKITECSLFEKEMIKTRLFELQNSIEKTLKYFPSFELLDVNFINLEKINLIDYSFEFTINDDRIIYYIYLDYKIKNNERFCDFYILAESEFNNCFLYKVNANFFMIANFNLFNQYEAQNRYKKIIKIMEKKNYDGHSRLQSACVRWFKYQYKEYEYRLIKIGNEVPIYNDELRIKLYNKFKSEGLLDGAPDMFLAVGNYLYNGLFIEFKYGNDRLRKKQVDVIKSLEEGNYRCVIVRSVDEFMEVIKEYLSIR